MMEELISQKSPDLPIKISVIISFKEDRQGRGLPCVELRRITTDTDLIKLIVSSAFHKRPIVMYPEFTDTMKSLGSLMSKGIVYKGDDDKFYFTI